VLRVSVNLIQIDYNSNAHNSVALSNNDGESYSSDFEASNNVNLPASDTRFVSYPCFLFHNTVFYYI